MSLQEEPGLFREPDDYDPGDDEPGLRGQDQAAEERRGGQDPDWAGTGPGLPLAERRPDSS